MLSDCVGDREPRRPVVVYDGACTRCRWWVERVGALDPAGRLRAMPLQDARAVRVTGRSTEQLVREVHLVHPDGGVVCGAEAVRDVLRYLRGGKVVAWLFTFPGVSWVAARAYGWVARRRVTRATPGTGNLTDKRNAGVRRYHDDAE